MDYPRLSLGEQRERERERESVKAAVTVTVRSNADEPINEYHRFLVFQDRRKRLHLKRSFSIDSDARVVKKLDFYRGILFTRPIVLRREEENYSSFYFVRK